MSSVKWRFTAVFLLLFLCTGCRRDKNTEPVQPPLRFAPPLASLQLKPVSRSPEKLLLRQRDTTILLHSGSSTVQFAEIPVLLPESVTGNEENFWSLGEYSCRNILRPLLNEELPQVKRILLDPGHGGHDTGAIAADGTMEKNLNLQLTLLLAEKLKQRGYTVFLTREDDRFLSLDARPEAIAGCQADLFISIHHNAAANHAASGYEIYAFNSFPETTDAARTVNSVPFALSAAKALKKLPVLPGRGVKFAQFKVLRLATCPAILVEAGFVSNPEEVKLLKQPEFQQNFAAQLAGFLPDLKTEKSIQRH